MSVAFIVLSFFCFGLVHSSHYRGGVIQWRPVNKTHFDGQIEITHRISWRRSYIYCDQNTINNRNLLGGGSLYCYRGCSGSLGSLNFYCTDFSVTENWSSGERTFTRNVGSIASFEAYYSGCCWVGLRRGGGYWRINVRGTLTPRLDNGLINSSPVTAITPVIRLQHGCRSTIHIPVQDPDGDVIRCRWASGYECGGVCQSFPEATLIGCALHYNGGGYTGWYAAALQVEDFLTVNSTAPMSSVPIQFMINIFSSHLSCTKIKPVIVEESLPNGACIPVPFGTTFSASVVAQVDHIGIRIVEFPTVSTLGIVKSAVTQSAHNPLLYYSNVTWTPQPSQYGLHIFCYSAVDTNSLTSDQVCIILLGGVQGPRAIHNTTVPSYNLTLGQSPYFFSVQFDQRIARPTLSSFIKIYENSTNTLVDSIDATSSRLVFPNEGSGGTELNFTSSYNFTSGTSYYVQLDLGVAVGSAFCNQESDPITTRTFWTFTAEIDECARGLYTCSHLATCVDTLVGYDCVCNPGYTGDGLTCSDVDECSIGMWVCPELNFCLNSIGSYTCPCKFGALLNGSCNDPPNPNPPQHLRVQSVAPTSATIAWSLPVVIPHLPISQYILTLTEQQFGLPQMNATVTRSNFSHTFSGLEEYNTYQCDMVAVSKYGDASMSESFSFRTSAAVSSAAPLNLTGMAASSSLIYLSWSDPPLIDINGNIVFYFVLVTEVHTGRNLTFHSFSKQITVGPLHAYYNYLCTVSIFTTTFGPFSPVISVYSAEDVPSAPPINFILGNVTTYSADLSWDPPVYEEQNGVIRHYIIYLTELSGLDSVKEIMSLTTNWILNDLRPSFCYAVSVAAYTIGAGPDTAQAQFCLETTAPSGPPQSVNGYPLNHTSFFVEWSPPSIHDQNGPIVAYVVNVTENDTQTTFKMITNGNETSLAFSMLHPDYIYCCEIAAVTIAEGPYSNPYCIRLHPGAPSGSPRRLESDLPDPNTIILSWEPPRPEEKNGQIIAYTINVTAERTGEVVQLSISQATVAIQNLVPYSNYSCVVSASTVAGMGPYSASYKVQTLEDVPSEPRNTEVSVVINEPTSLLVTWDPPYIFNGVITFYAAYCVQSGIIGLRPEEGTVADADSTSAKVVNLIPFTTYYCGATASTSAGEGNISVIASATTDESVPDDQPRNFQASQISMSTVVLTWEPPMRPYGVIVSYTVTFNVSTELLSVTRVNDHTYTASGLEAYTNYAFTVLASTRIGDGPSAEIMIQTAQSGPSAPPLNVQVSASTSTSSSLTWSPPLTLDQNGVIVYYLLIIRDLEFNTSDIIVNSTTTSYEFVGLNEYNRYDCQIAAATGVGLGPYSEPITFTTAQDVPSAPPQQLTGHAQSSSVVYLSWSPPPLLDTNGVIDHYTVRVIERHTGISWTFHATNEHITVGSLSPYFYYDCGVSAFTIGSGPFTQTLSVQTDQAAPSAPPGQLSALQTTDTLSLMWNAPSSEHTHGIISHYVAMISELNAARSYTGKKYSMNVSSTPTVATFNGLHPHYYYECKVAAYTVALGPATEPITVQLNEAAPTSPPINIIGVALSSESIHITWDPPPLEFQNGIIRSYNLEVMEDDTGTTTQHSSPSTQLTLFSLHPYYTYKFTIAAVTVDPGPISEPVSVQTDSEVPTAPVQNAALSVITSDTITLHWSPPDPEDQNGVISYRVNVTDVNRGIRFQQATSNLTMTLTSLRPFTVYLIRVAPYNIAGDGPYSIPFHVTTREAAPSIAPQNVMMTTISSTSLRVSWSPPPTDQHNGIIRYYRVNVTEVDSGDVFVETSLSSFIVLFNLHPFYTYECIIAAYTVAEGPSSDVETITTPEDVPSGFPQDVKNSSVTPRSAIISWDPPSEEDQNGIIINYTVSIAKAGTQQLFQLMSSQTSVTAMDLSPHTSYFVTVAASTFIGIGPYSIMITVTTPEDAPTSAPRSSNAVSHDSRTVHFSWSPPEEPNGVIRRYHVQVVETASGNTTHYTSHTTSIEITSLHPAYTYECSVAAFTTDLGPYSNPFTVTTPEDAPVGPPQSVALDSVSAREVTISYAPPLPEDQNGVIVHFEIKIRNLDMGDIEYYETSDLFLRIEELRPYTVYEVSVTANTAIGAGPFSELLVFRTNEAVPGSHPTNATGQALNATHILLTWEAPPEHLTHGIVREYRINITEDATGQVLHFTVSSDARRLMIGDLHPYYVYHCTIVAYTVEAGPYTDVIVVETKEAAPTGPPQGFKAAAPDSRSIQVYWFPPLPDEQNGVIRQYIVTITSVNGSDYDTRRVTQANLTISGLRPFTQYSLSIAAETVAIGPYTQFISLSTPEDVPTGPPLFVEASALSPTDLYIQWEAPAPDNTHGVIRRYIVNVTEMETESQEIHHTEDLYITLSFLHPAFQYRYLVAAETIGAGPYSEESTICMPEAAPSVPPMDVAAVSITSTSFTLQWTSPPFESRNGIIRHYIIKFTDGVSGEITQITTQSTTQQFENLHPYYNYTFIVAAVTIASGPFSESQSVLTLEDVPISPPREFSLTPGAQCSTSVLLRWEPLAEEDKNGLISGYTVAVMWAGSVILTQDVMETEFVISDLQPFMNYNFSLRAFTSIGSGPITYIVYTTCEDEPSEPRMLQKLNVTSRSVTLSWNAPASPNGIVRHYLVWIEETDTGSNRSIVSHSNTNVIVGGLHPYYTYEFTVRAVTLSSGPPSTILTVQTLQDVPSGYPDTVETFPVDSKTLFVEWEPLASEDRNGIILDYFVNITAVEASASFHVVSGGSLSVTIPGLHPYYTYNYILAAATVVGRGPFSMARAIQMPQDVPSGPPRNVSSTSINSTAIVINWQEPELSAQNGIISSYFIVLTDLQSGETREFRQPGSHLDLVVALLHPYYYYQYEIAAETAIGQGPFASPVSTQTPEDVPSGPPLELNITATSSRSVRISWEPPLPENQNGIIRLYSIVVKNTVTEETISLNTTNTFITINGLHPYYKYDFVVTAVTIDEGPYTGGGVTMPQDVPTGAPGDMQVESLSSSIISISWQSPSPELQNGEITSYDISVLEVATGAVLRFHALGTATFYIVNSLHPYYVYNCSVAAYTIGLGPKAYGSVLTHADESTDVPENVSVSIESATEVLVEWEPPPDEHHNGIIVGYMIQIHAVNTDEDMYLNVDNLVASVTNLHPFYSYEFSVAAVTIAEGPFSDPVLVQLPEAEPSSPVTNVTTVSVSSTSVRLAWYPPHPDQWNGEVVKYTVVYELLEGAQNIEYFSIPTFGQPLSNINDPVRVRLPLSMEMALIEGLEEDSEYKFEVFFETSAGRSDSSEFIQLKTSPDVPSGPPTNVTVTVLSASSINVQWGPPESSSRNGELIAYHVRLGALILNVSGGIYNALVEDLDSFTQYQVSVAAETIVGIGPYSLDVPAKTAESIPEAPVGLKLDIINSSSILLSWMEPVKPNGVILGYQVNYFGYKYDTVNKVVTINIVDGNYSYHVDGSKLEMVITGMKPALHYSFMVWARNGAGFSEISSSLQFDTSLIASESAATGASQSGSIVFAAVGWVIILVAVVALAVFLYRRRHKYSLKGLLKPGHTKPKISFRERANNSFYELPAGGLQFTNPAAVEDAESEMGDTEMKETGKLEKVDLSLAVENENAQEA